MDDRFSLTLAKTFIRVLRRLEHTDLWRQLWKFKGIRRASMTLWSTTQSILQMRSMLWRRHIVTDSSCYWCYDLNQDEVHLLQDCPLAAAVWLCLVPPACWSMFFSSQVGVDWIRTNILCRRLGSKWPIHWNYIFRQTVHEIWTNHNRRQHDRLMQHNPYGVAV